MSKKFLLDSIATAFGAMCLAALLFVGGYYVSKPGDLSPSPTVLVYVGDVMHGTAVYLGDGVYLTAKHNTAMEGLRIMGQDGTEYKIKEVHAFDNDVAFLIADGGPAGKARLACEADAHMGVSVFTEGYPQAKLIQRYVGHIASNVWNEDLPGPFTKYLAEGQILDIFVSPGLSGGGVFVGDYDIVAMVVALYSGQVPALAPIGIAVPASVICKYKQALDTRPQ